MSFANMVKIIEDHSLDYLDIGHYKRSSIEECYYWYFCKEDQQVFIKKTVYNEELAEEVGHENVLHEVDYDVSGRIEVYANMVIASFSTYKLEIINNKRILKRFSSMLQREFKKDKIKIYIFD